MSRNDEMKVNVKELLEHPGEPLAFLWDEPFEGEGVALEKSLRADLSLSDAGSRIIVQGSLEGSLRTVCARCNEAFFQPTALTIFENFVPSDSPEAAEKDEMDLSDLEIYTYEDHMLDLHEVIRQNLVASIPIKPLCREQCRGLCPVCGVNLNIEQCSCTVDETDPRWEGLKALRAKIEAPDPGPAGR